MQGEAERALRCRPVAGMNPEGMASPGRRAPFREFALSVGIDFSGALKVA
jgi:hypothetical protein